MQAHEVTYEGKLQSQHLPFYVCVDVLPLWHAGVLSHRKSIEALGAHITHEEGGTEEEDRALSHSLIAAGASLPLDILNMRTRDSLMVEYWAPNAEGLSLFLKNLQTVLPSGSFERVHFQFLEKVTPTPSLIDMFEQRRQQQGTSAHDVWVNKGFTNMQYSSGENHRTLEYKLPNGIKVDLELAKQQEQAPTHFLTGHCVLNCYGGKKPVPYTDLHAKQLTSAVDKMHRYAMNAQHNDPSLGR